MTNVGRTALFDALQKLVQEHAQAALDVAFADVDDYLFNRSEAGEEALGMLSLRSMRRVRAELIRDFRQSIKSGFDALCAATPGVAGDASDQHLTLLSEEDLEAQLAVEQLASAVLRSFGTDYEVATKRLCVVVGREPLRPREIPLGPAFLAMCLSRAMSAHALEGDLQIVIFKYFERELANVLGDLLDGCNQQMAKAGILPELRAGAVKARAKRTAAANAQQAPPEPEANASVPAPMPGVAAPALPISHTQMQPSAADQAMFAGMLSQLQGWRTMMGMAAAPAAAPGVGGSGAFGAPQTLETRDLMSVLSLMQRDAESLLPKQSASDGKFQSMAGLLREQLTQNARKLGMANDNVSLDGLDSDAVDLVALLFDVLLDGPQFDSGIRQRIGRMLVPFVKVAVKDRRMFLLKEHPARKLLNTVAEACEGNRGEAQQDRELLNHVDHTIDRLVAEFNEDVAIFETLEQELRDYMAQHRKRFELAERRSTEAQRGRERLEQAREAVSADLSAHRAGRRLPPALDVFLEKHAAHHLVQVALRGEDGAVRYDAGMRAVDELLAAFDHAAEGLLPAPGATLPEAELTAMLATAGCIGEGADAVIATLREVLIKLAGGQNISDVVLPEKVVIPEAAPLPPEPTPTLEVIAGTAELDYDAVMLERIRALQVGSWIQLAGADGVFAPAKISWISPISSRLLLVNRRGIRVLVASAEELAVMVKLDKALLREGGTAFDDAMTQMAGRLQSAAGKA